MRYRHARLSLDESLPIYETAPQAGYDEHYDKTCATIKTTQTGWYKPSGYSQAYQPHAGNLYVLRARKDARKAGHKARAKAKNTIKLRAQNTTARLSQPHRKQASNAPHAR
jgi:hypothetical protein